MTEKKICANFKLEYKIKDQKITIDCSDRHNFYTKYFVDNIEKSRVYLKNNSLKFPTFFKRQTYRFKS